MAKATMGSPQSTHPCPLCHSDESSVVSRDDDRLYFQCPTCALVFVPPQAFLSTEAEKAEYDLHQNDPQDLGYQGYLARLATPLLERLRPGMTGLDFGSGPGPALAPMLAAKGYPTALYDPFYHNDLAALQQPYDFITATEVLEHLHHPRRDLSTLIALLQPQGYLGIMTQFLPPLDQFPRWHYKRDPTHICFYSPPTFEWIATKWRLTLEWMAKGVVIFQTP